MKKMYLSVVIALSLAVISSAQTARQRAVPQREKIATYKAFDLSIENLPPKFIGHPLRRVVTTILDRQREMTKGEYEKIEAFAARVKDIKSQPILGSLGYGDLFAFAFTPHAEYDADKEALTISATIQRLTSARVEAYGGHYTSPINVESQVISTERYSAQNAFGANFIVTKIHSQNLALNAINYRQFAAFMPAGDEPLSFAYRILLPIKLASQVKDGHRVLFIGRLAQSGLWEDLGGERATFNAPTDTLIQAHVLDIELQEIWFYHFDSGTVLAKYQSDRK